MVSTFALAGEMQPLELLGNYEQVCAEQCNVFESLQVKLRVNVASHDITGHPEQPPRAWTPDCHSQKRSAVAAIPHLSPQRVFIVIERTEERSDIVNRVRCRIGEAD
jgi:hypothetical protein